MLNADPNAGKYATSNQISSPFSLRFLLPSAYVQQISGLSNCFQQKTIAET